jgi:TRAP-type C4-dicarboxylate transport system substrate-binding protein
LKWFNAQPKEFQQAIETAAREMIVKERQLFAEQEKVATDDLKSKGVQFNAVKDKAAFMKIVEPIHKDFETRLGKDLLDLARNPK